MSVDRLAKPRTVNRDSRRVRLTQVGSQVDARQHLHRSRINDASNDFDVRVNGLVVVKRIRGGLVLYELIKARERCEIRTDPSCTFTCPWSDAITFMWSSDICVRRVF